MCGKNLAKRLIKLVRPGSPPRVREKQQTFISVDSNAGITPACAGKTGVEFCFIVHIQDHPRVCGKNLVNTVLNPDSEGSPPRVREKPLESLVNQCVTGITPACAGKTHQRIILSCVGWDHPRVCGKNSSKLLDDVTSSGSPPRVREKRAVFRRNVQLMRITPACAGKTGLYALTQKTKRDHPRVCGKNTKRSQ